MSDMPERIFAWLFLEDIQDDSMRGGWTDVREKRLQEYVRADLHRSLALDALASDTQAADAYAAQLKAEAMAEKLAEALANSQAMLRALNAESGREVQWGEEDAFRMGEWFEKDDLDAMNAAASALAEYEASK